MIKVEGFTVKGTRTSECGDYISNYKSGNISCIALSDGASSNKYGSIGASIAAMTTSKFIGENFDYFYDLDKKRLKHYLLSEIIKKIDNTAKANETDVKEFGATLLCFAYDESDGRYISIQIGDGIISVTDSNGTYLSRPMNGITKKFTVLLTNYGVVNYSRIVTGKNSSIKNAILMSDGAASIIENDGIKSDKTAILKSGDLNMIKTESQKITSDDISAIKIERVVK